MSGIKQYSIVTTDKSDPLYMTPEDVEILAVKLNNAMLYKCITLYKIGRVSWEQVMQIAAVELAKHAHNLIDEIVRIKSCSPPAYFIQTTPAKPDPAASEAR